MCTIARSIRRHALTARGLHLIREPRRSVSTMIVHPATIGRPPRMGNAPMAKFSHPGMLPERSPDERSDCNCQPCFHGRHTPRKDDIIEGIERASYGASPLRSTNHAQNAREPPDRHPTGPPSLAPLNKLETA